MEFSAFDARRYPTLGVREGYGEWAETYDATVVDLMDLRLLSRLEQVDWSGTRRAVDLACGTGRTGAWLKSAGVQAIDGVDFTPEMLERARSRGTYERLVERDLTNTGLDGASYDLVSLALADEHLRELGPLYCEAARLAVPGGRLVVVGYHPHFLMAGIAAHFTRPGGEAVAVESYVHLTSDHVRAAQAAGWRLLEMDEGTIDDEWIAAKPKWAVFRHHPVSFALVWHKPRGGS